jgi:cell division protein ZapA
MSNVLMTSQAVQVQILGRAIKVNCPAGQEAALKEAAKDLDNRVNELSERTKVTNTEQLLTITSLNICYELHMAKKEASQHSSDVYERMGLLASALEAAISTVKPSQIEENTAE